MWQLSLRKGYGRFKVAGRTLVASRYAYEEFVGPIPDGMEIDHLCFTPGCVNPDHLEPVTRAENARRRDAHTQRPRDMAGRFI
jgi:hypothetical protein